MAEEGPELTEDRRNAAIVFIRSLGVNDLIVSAALAPGAHQAPRHRIAVISSPPDELVVG